MSNKHKEALAGLAIFVVIAAVVFGILAALFFGIPKWSEWRKGVAGAGDLSKAQSTRQVRVEEAKAELEAAKLDAQAEVERAKGAAQAIEIEGGNLTDEYIKYRWVMQMEQSDNRPTYIYVPTEAGLPVLEAGKRP